MAYDSKLAERIRGALAVRADVKERKMFGGVAFLLNGNMCCGVHRDELIVRLDPATAADALARAHTRVFDLTGRPMKGWLMVEPAGLVSAASLRGWLQMAVDYASSLPAK